MKRIAALVLCALLLFSLSGCQPSREALLRQGIKIEELDPGALCEMMEAAILSGQTELRLNYRGRQAAVEQAVRDGLWKARESGSYPLRRFLAAYDVSFTQERGYVATHITLTPAKMSLLADMPRDAQGGLAVEAYGAGVLEALLTHMMEAKQQQALRLYKWQDLDALNATLKKDLDVVLNTNYAYVYLVSSAQWVLSEYSGTDGETFVELDINLEYEPDTIPLTDIPVVDNSLEMIDALVEGWAAGADKVTLILEDMRPDEETLFSWINTAEVNSASLACEGDSIWYELLENPSPRQICRFWLEFDAKDSRIAEAQAELDNAIAAEAQTLKARLGEGTDAKTAYRAVFERVMEITEYDDDIREATEQKTLTQEMQILRSAYGALVAGKTVCTGYARAFQALCNELGLPCWTINGYQDGEGHAWNMVRLSGETLYVDCTFADTGDRPNKYFLTSAEEMETRDYVPDEGFVMPW
ncbi:MAG: transglutaminase domain-containing protein [Candidatus Pelethousia sp.]|nr:transglutaminase domain-containing protein [Candidatus Pelethousia sp.]